MSSVVPFTEVVKSLVGRCCVCGTYGADRAHIKTVGAGATWEDWEFVPLCRKCHIEQHKVGIKTFHDKHLGYQYALKARGWSWLMGKLYHPKILEKDEE